MGKKKVKTKEQKDFDKSFDDDLILGFSMYDEKGNYIDPVKYFNIEWL